MRHDVRRVAQAARTARSPSKMCQQRSVASPTFVLAAGLLAATAQAQVDWHDVSPLVPTPRTGHAMVADFARGRLVVFGGRLSLSSVVYSADTIEWDGGQWTVCQPVTSPPARGGHSMAFDALRGRTVLFGGWSDSGSLLNDTWEWDGVNWQSRASLLQPAARASSAMAYDLGRGANPAVRRLWQHPWPRARRHVGVGWFSVVPARATVAAAGPL